MNRSPLQGPRYLLEVLSMRMERGELPVETHASLLVVRRSLDTPYSSSKARS